MRYYHSFRWQAILLYKVQLFKEIRCTSQRANDVYTTWYKRGDGELFCRSSWTHLLSACWVDRIFSILCKRDNFGNFLTCFPVYQALSERGLSQKERTYYQSTYAAKPENGILISTRWRQPVKELTHNVSSDICVQRTIKSPCPPARSDQSHLCPHEGTWHSYLSKNVPSEDSDQTARMRSLIWVFAGRRCPKIRFLMLRLNLSLTSTGLRHLTFPARDLRIVNCFTQ